MKTSILGKAHQAGLFDFEVYQLRDFASDKHRTVDDAAYGGGSGMILKLEPLVAAVESIQAGLSEQGSQVIYFSPAGKRLNHSLIIQLSSQPDTRHLILVSGHYEGVDQRFVDGWVDTEISLGDFVVTGGELPSLAFADSLVRQLDGVLKNPSAPKEESFSLEDLETQATLLEYPHYTRPPEFQGLRVPPILLSGNHSAIENWRREQAKERTKKFRPDLLTPS